MFGLCKNSGVPCQWQRHTARHHCLPQCLAWMRPSLSGLAAPLTFTTNASTTTLLLQPERHSARIQRTACWDEQCPGMGPRNPAS